MQLECQRCFADSFQIQIQQREEHVPQPTVDFGPCLEQIHGRLSQLDHRNELKEVRSELNLLSQQGSQARNGLNKALHLGAPW